MYGSRSKFYSITQWRLGFVALADPWFEQRTACYLRTPVRWATIPMSHHPHLLTDVKYSWCEQTNMFFFKNVGYYITCNIRIVEQHVFKHFGVTIWIKRIFWIFLKHVNYLKLLQKEIRWKQIEEEKTNIKNIKNI